MRVLYTKIAGSPSSLQRPTLKQLAPRRPRVGLACGTQQAVRQDARDLNTHQVRLPTQPAPSAGSTGAAALPSVQCPTGRQLWPRATLSRLQQYGAWNSSHDSAITRYRAWGSPARQLPTGSRRSPWSITAAQTLAHQADRLQPPLSGHSHVLLRPLSSHSQAND